MNKLLDELKKKKTTRWVRFERATSCVTPCVFYTSDQESLTNKLKKAQYSKDKNKINI